MGSVLGGGSDKTKTTSEPPKWWSDAAQKALEQGARVAQIGYVPNMGPSVAAFNPQMVDAFQQSADWSAAFNTPGVAAPRVFDSIMPATDFGNGLMGYSSYPGFMNSVNALAEQYPGLAAYLQSFFINPVTGVPGSNSGNAPNPGGPGNPGGGPGNPDGGPSQGGPNRHLTGPGSALFNAKGINKQLWGASNTGRGSGGGSAKFQNRPKNISPI